MRKWLAVISTTGAMAAVSLAVSLLLPVGLASGQDAITPEAEKTTPLVSVVEEAATETADGHTNGDIHDHPEGTDHHMAEGPATTPTALPTTAPQKPTTTPTATATRTTTTRTTTMTTAMMTLTPTVTTMSTVMTTATTALPDPPQPANVGVTREGHCRCRWRTRFDRGMRDQH